MGVTGICEDKVCVHSNKEDWDNVIIIHSKVGGSGAEKSHLTSVGCFEDIGIITKLGNMAAELPDIRGFRIGFNYGTH